MSLKRYMELFGRFSMYGRPWKLRKSVLCGREDLNLHALRHSLLKTARLPVPPRPPKHCCWRLYKAKSLNLCIVANSDRFHNCALGETWTLTSSRTHAPEACLSANSSTRAAFIATVNYTIKVAQCGRKLANFSIQCAVKAGVAEPVDAQDLKSCPWFQGYGFESHPRHQKKL